MSTHRMQAGEVKRVVVQGANWVGDAAMTVAALRRLREVLPGRHITLATRSRTAGVFRENDFIDDLLPQDPGNGVFQNLFGRVKEWRRRDFDLAVLFPNAFAPALVAALARVPFRVGYSTEHRGFLLSNAIPVPSWRAERHEVFYYLNIIDALETALFGRTAGGYLPDARIEVSEERKSEGRKLLSASGWTGSGPLVVVCPGSTNSRAKRWPAERFARLADLFIKEAGASVVLIGSADEVDVSADVESHMSHQPIILTGQTSLSQVVEILSVADLLVTNDTGPAHVSSAVGCRTLVVFGPTNPATTRPFSDSSEIIRKPPVCAPCMLRDCPIDHRCMTAITPDEVFERACILIKRGRGEALAS